MGQLRRALQSIEKGQGLDGGEREFQVCVVAVKLHRRVSLYEQRTLERFGRGLHRRYYGDQGFTWVLKRCSVTMDDLRSNCRDPLPQPRFPYVLSLSTSSTLCFSSTRPFTLFLQSLLLPTKKTFPIYDHSFWCRPFDYNSPYPCQLLLSIRWKFYGLTFVVVSFSFLVTTNFDPFIRHTYPLTSSFASRISLPAVFLYRDW